MPSIPSNGTPDFYTELLNIARQQLVRQPDGSYAQSPQFGGNTSLDAIYGGILPSPPAQRAGNPGAGSSWRTAQGRVYDPSWWSAPPSPPAVQTATQPFVAPPTMGATRTEQSGMRPAMTQGTQMAGTTQMAPGARPQSVDQAFAQMGAPAAQPGMFGRGIPAATQTAQASTAWDPFNPHTPKFQDRLPLNSGEDAFLAAFGPQAPANPALGAIDDQLGGSGRSTASPFPLPFFRRPTAPQDFSRLPNVAENQPIDITVNGGNRMPGSAFSGGWGSTSGGVPMPPMPRNRPDPPTQTVLAPPNQGVPSIPSPRNTGTYTIQKGDNLEKLAKQFGTTVNQIANANGISNPNKIRAGATLNLGFMAPPVPRMATASVRTPPRVTTATRPRETFDQIWNEARGG